MPNYCMRAGGGGLVALPHAGWIICVPEAAFIEDVKAGYEVGLLYVYDVKMIHRHVHMYRRRHTHTHSK